MSYKPNMERVKHPMVEQMVYDIHHALEQFGEYSFNDKGPGEVMEVYHWVGQVQGLPVAEAADVLLQLASTGRHGEKLASEILLELQDWDELFDNEEVAELL